MQAKKLLLPVLTIIFIMVGFANADERSYVWTYEYQTMERGEGEFEHYMTFSTPDWATFTGMTTVEHQIEYEFGMSERFDIGVYQIFKQLPGEDLRYSGFKLRGRYRFGEKGSYFMDPLLYFEYKNKPDFSQQKIEMKMILAKDFGRLNIALNPYFEVEQGSDETEFKLKYALGMSYKLSRLMSLGVEAKGGESGHYFGPTLSHGGEQFWVAIGGLFKIGTVEEGKPEFMTRTIIGIRF